MNANQYTQKSREAIEGAQNLALENHQQEVVSCHLLYALLKQEKGLIPRLLAHCNTDVSGLITETKNLMDKLPQVHGYEGSLSLGSGLARALVKAEKEAQEMKDSYISTEHLLLGLLTEGDRDVQDLFRKAGLTRDVILAA